VSEGDHDLMRMLAEMAGQLRIERFKNETLKAKLAAIFNGNI